jgi:hypothetical protein
LRRLVEHVCIDRSLKRIDSQMAGNVEEDPAPDYSPCLVMNSEPASAGAGGDQTGPESVVQDVMSTDVRVAVELGAHLQRQNHDVIGALYPDRPQVSEHVVTGGATEEVLHWRAGGHMRSAPADRQAQRERLPGPNQRRRG